MDLRNNHALLLGKNKAFVEKYLQKNNWTYEYFPAEQIKDGFDILETCSLLFWFDTTGVVHTISTTSKYNETVPLYFEGEEIFKVGYSYIVINYLKSYAVSITEKDFHEDDIGSYKLLEITLPQGIIFRINVNTKSTIFGFLVYFGYTPFNYVNGVSLSEFMDEKGKALNS